MLEEARVLGWPSAGSAPRAEASKGAGEEAGGQGAAKEVPWGRNHYQSTQRTFLAPSG